MSVARLTLEWQGSIIPVPKHLICCQSISNFSKHEHFQKGQKTLVRACAVLDLLPACLYTQKFLATAVYILLPI
jgi:hypothetical protein